RMGPAGDFRAVWPDVRDIAEGTDLEVAEGEAHFGDRGADAHAPFGGNVPPAQVGAHHLAAGEELFRLLAANAGAEGLPDLLQRVALADGELDKPVLPA